MAISNGHAAPASAPAAAGPQSAADPSIPLPAILARGVRHSFPAAGGRRLLVLDGIDLRLEPGEIVALVGPNGSGKSTLLRILGGLLVADAGTVHISGEQLAGPAAHAAFVFQDPRLLPWRGVARNVALPMEYAGWSATRRRARIEELIDLVGLHGFERARPHELSGGMRQRAAIARALALTPSVLLLDEPFSALDALTREQFNADLLDRWRTTATSIVMVTHSIAEALFLADRVLVMSERPGRIAAEIVVPLARPRSLNTIDELAVGRLSREIRGYLGPHGVREAGQ